MKLLQIAFIAVLGTACIATYVTSETLHEQRIVAEQGTTPALPKS
jgi:hypothetical protein